MNQCACCWWCTLDILGESLAIPYNYDDRGRQFSTMGQFCSWECMKSYNLKENRIKFGEIQQFITLTRKIKYGKILPLKCAPDRYTLKKFGGKFTEEEYRSHFAVLPPVCSMPNNQHRLHTVVIREDKAHKDTEDEKKKRLKNISNCTTKTDTLKLKRPVPVKLNTNNLESMLCITRTTRD